MADLLAWAKANNLKVTGGYRTPERNRQVGGSPKSYHMQGDPQHPKALDLDPAGIELAWLKSRLPAGYEVIDERGKKGAPHYHIEPTGNPQPKKIAQAPKAQSRNPVRQNTSLTVPTRENVDTVLKQANDLIAKFRQNQPKAAPPLDIPAVQARISQRIPHNISPTFDSSLIGPKPERDPGTLQSINLGFQTPFNPYAKAPNNLAGAVGEFAGRAALPVAAGLAGGGIPLIAGAGFATGVAREDTRQLRQNEAPDAGKTIASGLSESLVAAPFMGNKFLPNALVGGGVSGVQSSVDQLNSTGQIDAGRLAQDITSGGVLSGGLAKMFGRAVDVPPPPAPLRDSPDGFYRPGQREAAASLELQKQTALQSAAQEQIDLANRAAILQAKRGQDAMAKATAEAEAIMRRPETPPEVLLPQAPEVQIPQGFKSVETTPAGVEILSQSRQPAQQILDPTGKPYVAPEQQLPETPPVPLDPVSVVPEAPQRPVFAKSNAAKDEALRLSKETGIPHEVTTQGGMHFVHEVGNNAGLETVKVPRGTKVTVDGEEFTLQGQAGGKVKIKNATGERIIDEALVEGLPLQQAKLTDVKPVSDAAKIRANEELLSEIFGGKTDLSESPAGDFLEKATGRKAEFDPLNPKGDYQRIFVGGQDGWIKFKRNAPIGEVMTPGLQKTLARTIDDATLAEWHNRAFGQKMLEQGYSENTYTKQLEDNAIREIEALDSQWAKAANEAERSYHDILNRMQKAPTIEEASKLFDELDNHQEFLNDEHYSAAARILGDKTNNAGSSAPGANEARQGDSLQGADSGIESPGARLTEPSPDDVRARLSRGNLVDKGDPEAITSFADLQAKKPGLYEGLDPKQQLIVDANLRAIELGEAIEAPYIPKKGDTNQIKSGGQASVKAYKPSHLSAAGNTLEVWAKNTEGNVARYIIDDARNPGAKWGFQDVPKASTQVIPDAPVAKREAITPRAESEAAIAQVKKLSEMAPDNRTIQNAAKILEKDNLTVKDVKRAQKALEDGSVTDAELRKMMDEFKAIEGTSNCGK